MTIGPGKYQISKDNLMWKSPYYDTVTALTHTRNDLDKIQADFIVANYKNKELNQGSNKYDPDSPLNRPRNIILSAMKAQRLFKLHKKVYQAKKKKK